MGQTACRELPDWHALNALTFGDVPLQWQKRRAKVLLASQKARWQMLEKGNAGFTVSESCTLGWLNVILRHLWPTLIEKEVAEATTKQIQVRPPSSRYPNGRIAAHAGSSVVLSDVNSTASHGAATSGRSRSRSC